MSVVAPPEPPRQDELEALIREARARQRRRWSLTVATVAVAAAASLSAWAAIPGLGSAGSAAGGDPGAAVSRGIDNAGRVPIVQVGTSGGVTWALNGLGMWLTTNGGRTWRPSAPKHVRDMGDLIARVEQVDFVDRSHAWLLAVDVDGGLHSANKRHAELDRTSDGGRTWHWTIPKGCCGAVSFLTPSRGFFLGARRLFATQDGGRSWRPVARTPFAWGAPTFVDARHGVAVVGKGRLYSTSDAGKTWASAHVPLRQGALPDVSAFGHRIVVPAELIGPSKTRLVMYVSDDRGATWQARPAPNWFVPTIGTSDATEYSAASSNVWYAVSWHTLAVTTDAGRSWRRVKVATWPAGWTISAIDFTSPLAGWAIFERSNQSVLMRTTDGGVHWAPAGPRTSRHANHG